MSEPRVYGKSLDPAPALYIPAAALRLRLDHFEGPMDLLLHLVRKNRFDITDIPMAQLCEQYAEYARGISAAGMDIAADYLSMSALLVEIKSKMLLPKPPPENGEEEDPRADLVRRLLEYERMRAAALALAAMPRRARDFVSPDIAVEKPEPPPQKPSLQIERLAQCFSEALARARARAPYEMLRQTMTVRAAMSMLLRKLRNVGRAAVGFFSLAPRGAAGLSFVALLQLAAENTVTLAQENESAELQIALTAAGDGGNGN